jgi:hypothetical protein
MAQRSRILALAENEGNPGRKMRKNVWTDSPLRRMLRLLRLSQLLNSSRPTIAFHVLLLYPRQHSFIVSLSSDYVHTNKLEMKNSKGCNRSTSNSSISLTFTNISSAFAQVLSVHNRDLQLTLSVNLTYCSRSLNAFQCRSSERIVAN